MSAQSVPQPIFDTLHELTEQPPKQLLKNKPQYALTDYQYAARFLFSYRGSEATFNAYRREIERLLHWAWSIAKQSISELKREHIEQFIEFCQNPPTSWIGTKQLARFLNKDGRRVPNPEWRPFVASVTKTAFQQGQSADIKQHMLSQKAVQAIFATLSSFYNFLITEDYVPYNPVAQIRQKSKFIRKQQTTQQIRRLSELQWEYVINTAEKMADREPAQHERTLFIMNCLYGMYLRISELASSERWQPKMGDFFRDQDGNWWFTTVGKGNKQREISVSDAMLGALKRYRASRNLSTLPTLNEATALIPKTRGKGGITSTRQIRSIVQHCFDQTGLELRKDGFELEAEQLQAATVHWLRHTGISDDVKHRPREHVRDDAGHGSSAITDRYIDIERRARHASARNKKINPDD